jgi:hypothetical protein
MAREAREHLTIYLVSALGSIIGGFAFCQFSTALSSASPIGVR